MAASSDNPVLADWGGPHGGAPAFDQVETEHFIPALEAAMAREARRDRGDRGQSRRRRPSPTRWRRWRRPARG